MSLAFSFCASSWRNIATLTGHTARCGSLIAHKKAGEQDIAEYLLWVELERMGLTGTPKNELLRVAKNLQNLNLPPLENPEPPAQR
jgi:hypothetical protein